MKIVYEVGDVVLLPARGTRHRIVSQFHAIDPVLGIAGDYQYLSLEPPGPSDVFDATDARRVIPLLTGFLYYHQQRPVGVAVSSISPEDAAPGLSAMQAGGLQVYGIPVHLDFTSATRQTFVLVAGSWFR